MRTRFTLTLLNFFWLVGCVFGQPVDSGLGSQEITVFAASSLSDTFDELARAFETQIDDVKVTLNFAGSSHLAAQLSEGIAADVFASANPTQMRIVIDAGLVEAGTEALFVSNRLTVIVPVDNPAGIRSWEDLAKPGVRLILAAEGVPVREYVDAIVYAMAVNFQDRFYANLVSEEDNVRQVSAKVALGEADAGIVYSSDVTPAIVDLVQQIAIPEAHNVIAPYQIAPLIDAPSPELAQRFIHFILSEEGQSILSRWGFAPPPVIMENYFEPD